MPRPNSLEILLQSLTQGYGLGQQRHSLRLANRRYDAQQAQQATDRAREQERYQAQIAYRDRQDALQARQRQADPYLRAAPDYERGLQSIGPLQRWIESGDQSLLPAPVPERNLPAMRVSNAGPFSGFGTPPIKIPPRPGGLEGVALGFGRPLADIRDERNFEQQQAVAAAKAAETEAQKKLDRESRERIARERVAATLAAAGMQQDTALFREGVDFFLKQWDATGDPRYAEQNWLAFMQRNRPKPRVPTGSLGAQIPGDETLTPFGAKIETPDIIRARATARNAATNETRAKNTYDLGKLRIHVQKEANQIRKSLGETANSIRAEANLIRRQEMTFKQGYKNRQLELDAFKASMDAFKAQSVDPASKAKYDTLIKRAIGLQEQANRALIEGDDKSYERIRKGAEDLFNEAAAQLPSARPTPKVPSVKAKAFGGQTPQQARGEFIQTLISSGKSPKEAERIANQQRWR